MNPCRPSRQGFVLASLPPGSPALHCLFSSSMCTGDYLSSCRGPILVHPYGPGGYVLRVRCGRCTPCRRIKSQAWVGRLRLEAECHDHVSFMTLTYAPEHYPGGFVYRDVQLFLKRVRNRYGADVRFFCVGELGGKHERHHWHVLVYGPPIPPGLNHLPELWPYGRHDAEVPLTGGVDHYLAGYVFKNSQKTEWLARMSLRPAIGFNRLDQLATMAASRSNSCSLGGELIGWPSTFSVGGKSYPLIGGAKRHWQAKYLSAGGIPPKVLSPEQNHQVALEELWGVPVSEVKALQRLHRIEEGFDRHAIQKTKRV